MNVGDLCQTLDQIAPPRLAEDWDNVGLLIGDGSRRVSRVMTCLTITPDVVDEAKDRDADVIVTHHPLPFRPLSKITRENVTGDMLVRLMSDGIAVYSGHTAYDSAADGINQQWAESLGLLDIRPLHPIDASDDGTLPADDVGSALSRPQAGAGRCGRLATQSSLADLADAARRICHASMIRCVGDPASDLKQVAIACGSGGSFLAEAADQGCQALITGEATFHTCLEARSRKVDLILVGHYASERFAMESLAGRIKDLHPELSVWPSDVESDPLWTHSQ